MFKKLKEKINMINTTSDCNKETTSVLSIHILIGFSLIMSAYIFGEHFNSSCSTLYKIYFGVLLLFTIIAYIKFSTDIVAIVCSQKLMINVLSAQNKDLHIKLDMLEEKNTTSVD